MSTAYAVHDAPERTRKRKKSANAVSNVVAGPLQVVHPYYDFGPVLSRHAIFNLVIGARGRGKSYGAKRLVIRKNIRKGELFIVLRRYDKELIFRDSWFNDIVHEFPEWDFKSVGDKFYKSPASERDSAKRNWEVIGYAIALSTAARYKSTPFPKVTTIIFEEFLIDKGHVIYLPNEVKSLMDFFNTVDRWQDKTTVLMLANSVMIDNPYFATWKIDVGDEEFIKLLDGEIIVHIDKNENFQGSVLDTRFGRMIAHTEYGDYAAGNTFNDNTMELIAEKTSNAKHWFNFETRAGSVAIWQDDSDNTLYATAKMPPGQLHLTLLADRLNEQKTLVFMQDLIVKQVMSSFRNKKLFSDTPGTRAIIRDLFRTSR